jgi:hypothetical protein
MNKIFLLSGLLFISMSVNAQVLGYTDIGLLFSTESKQGTARSMAMKSSFGALGGDLSALIDNPAGAAVFSNNLVGFTLANKHIDLGTDFYGTKHDNTFDHFSFSQAGGVLLLLNEYDDSEFKKISFAVNMQKLNDYNNEWTANGKSIPTWTTNPIDETINYNILDSQEYTNYTKGNHTNVNFSVATQYRKSLYIGASINIYEIDFTEESERIEKVYDTNNNTLEAYESFWQEIKGDGFSLGLGMIYKINYNLRIGFSYTTPTWYELIEESNLFEEDEEDVIGYYELIYSDIDGMYYNSRTKVQTYDYKLRTPSKTKASFAYVFGENGLISGDLTRKNYKTIHLGSNSIFNVENNDIKNSYRNTLAFNLGTEWRIKKLSLRGGFAYEQTPYADFIDTDNKRGFSLGLGYDFGNYIFDLAYDYSSNTDYYNYYTDIGGINGADLTNNTIFFLGTLVIKL